jgi:hydroxymethylglutaryl-CoA lyase
MTDLPKKVTIKEEGPREGFQIEKGPIATDRKVELIDALGETGLRYIQIVSFVNPRRVPGMADAEEVVKRYNRKPGVRYTALWLNEQGFRRAQSTGRLDLQGSAILATSDPFSIKNQNADFEQYAAQQDKQLALYAAEGIHPLRAGVMAAFGCNYTGDVQGAQVIRCIERLLELAAKNGVAYEYVSLADTMGWATPATVKRIVGAVRERWPALELALHLHDTRGMGVANAYAGLEMGITRYDAAVAGLGGCPFAGNAGAAGNVCTEDLVFLCEEMGIETGIDLEKLIACARLAEDIVGHPLPGSVKVGGALSRLRRAVGEAKAA